MVAWRDPIVAELRTFLGVDADEAALYVHVSAHGPSRASELAEALHLHRSEVYRAMERLEGLGLVLASAERPTLYAAVSLQAVLDAQIATREAAVESLRATRKELEEILLATRHEAQPLRASYKILRGPTEIHQARRALLSKATKSIDWASTSVPSIRTWLGPGESEALKKKIAEGVRFRALLPPSPEAKEFAATVVGEGAQVRTLGTHAPIRFCIADGQEMFIFIVHDVHDVSQDRAADDVAIVTSAPGFLLAQQTFFEQLWSAGQPPAPRAPTIEPNAPHEMGLLEPRPRRVQPIRSARE